LLHLVAMLGGDRGIGEPVLGVRRDGHERVVHLMGYPGEELPRRGEAALLLGPVPEHPGHLVEVRREPTRFVHPLYGDLYRQLPPAISRAASDRASRIPARSRSACAMAARRSSGTAGPAGVCERARASATSVRAESSVAPAGTTRAAAARRASRNASCVSWLRRVRS